MRAESTKSSRNATGPQKFGAWPKILLARVMMKDMAEMYRKTPTEVNKLKNIVFDCLILFFLGYYFNIGQKFINMDVGFDVFINLAYLAGRVN